MKNIETQPKETTPASSSLETALAFIYLTSCYDQLTPLQRTYLVAKIAFEKAAAEITRRLKSSKLQL